ncbi:hypothetical protein RND71_019124 [Anisodus tanguticus]|uniref:Uncharacterized protein n=1 Tax=Anisodus tanguticus TaxID=243964 RepID=A0AAE1V955_9SOLA|nr:hypothetical protein RND71_019124 [Anisodus tanguticus]
MSKRGFHQIHEAFPREIHDNRNPVAIDSPHEAFLQAWWGKFYEAHTSRFPDFPVFAAKSFDKVAQTLENIVANSGPANQSYASDHTGVNISNVMPVISSPHLMASSPLMESGADLTDAGISDLLSRDIPSSLQMNEMDDMLRFASNVGYQMPIIPPWWNAREDGINLGGPTQMEPNIHGHANALPASPKLSDAAGSSNDCS